MGDRFAVRPRPGDAAVPLGDTVVHPPVLIRPGSGRAGRSLPPECALGGHRFVFGGGALIHNHFFPHRGHDRRPGTIRGLSDCPGHSCPAAIPDRLPRAVQSGRAERPPPRIAPPRSSVVTSAAAAHSMSPPTTLCSAWEPTLPLPTVWPLTSAESGLNFPIAGCPTTTPNRRVCVLYE